MLKIILVCNAGMSTAMMAKKMKRDDNILFQKKYQKKQNK